MVQEGAAQLVVVNPPVWIIVLQVWMQDGTGSVVVQARSAVVVEDITLSVGELAGELSVMGPSVTGGDVQLPIVIPKILIHGR